MAFLHEFFQVNRPVVLFVYGQTFFVMGLAIFLQSRRHSRLRLARDLRWLAAFGILHGLHEWGDVFLPIQSEYLPRPYIELLLAVQVILLALSFVCLFIFGVVALDRRWRWGLQIIVAPAMIWGVAFFVSLHFLPNTETWHHLSSIWARYLLGLPGSLLAAYGLRYQAVTNVLPLKADKIYRALRVAGFTLVAYAVLGGVIVPRGDFFPASLVNTTTFESLVSVPIEVFRSFVGLALAVSMIRALGIFEIEVDRLIEAMEVERIKTGERERIGQEIHDGAVQAVYSAALILESIEQHVQYESEAAIRLDRAKRVLSGAINDLRRYMVSLRSDVPAEPLVKSLRTLINDPRFASLLHIKLRAEVEPDLTPVQIGHVLAIVQESLSNSVRHANAHHITISLRRETDSTILSAEDDGDGFDEPTITPGFGLRAMRDRARLLGGRLNIQSRKGKGTTMTLTLPEDNARDTTANTAGR